MREAPSSHLAAVDPRFKDLYRLGGISMIIVAVMILLAIVTYLIWPYTPTAGSARDIFEYLQRALLPALISLDLLLLVIVLINILPLMALWAVLKSVNESYALIALVFGLLAAAGVIAARPLIEMTALANLYEQAASTAEQERYLSAGEALRVLFDGTAWFVQTTLLLLGGLINGILMLRSPHFTKGMAWTGVAIAAIGLPFFVPKLGILLLFANTLLTIPWYLWIAPVFLRLARGKGREK